MLGLEVSANSSGVALDMFEMGLDVATQLLLVARHPSPVNIGFHIRIEVLVRIEFRAVSRQILQLDLFLLTLQLLFDAFAMMHPQVIHDHDDLAPLGCLHALRQPFDEHFRCQCAFVNHEARFALVGDAADMVDP